MAKRVVLAAETKCPWCGARAVRNEYGGRVEYFCLDGCGRYGATVVSSRDSA